MLDLLLAAPKDKRREMIKRLNPATKKRIFDNIYTMTEELGLDDVPDFETRVKMRQELIQRFPDMVFWDYAECANAYSPIRKKDVTDFERFPACKISTRGDVVVFGNGISKKLLIHTLSFSSNYPVFELGKRIDGSKHRVGKTIHRLVASTFILRPDRLKHIPYRELEVNHIDSVRWNCQVGNLEWVLTSENQRHRQGYEHYGEEKYFLFKVTIDNGFMGREFVLSEHSLHLIGTDFSRLRNTLDVRGFYKGMSVRFISRDDIGDIPVGFPADIAELFNRDERYFNVRIAPVIGTVIGGKYAGHQFSLFGTENILQYFNEQGPYMAARGDLHSHYGCTFRYATHAEAIPLHNKITKEIVDDARKLSNRYTPKRKKSKDP